MGRLMAGTATCLVLSGSLLGGAPRWDPVPPEAWAIKASAIPGGRGALILDKRITVKADDLILAQRIRICTEAGKGAAESAMVGEDGEISGRVVYPDGREVAFDKRKDFTTKVVQSTREGEVTLKHLVPPGLTEDCIVDLRVRIATDWSDYHIGSFYHSFDLLEAYPVETLVVRLEKGIRFHSVVARSTWTCEEGEDPQAVTYTFRHLPGLEEVPYCLRPLREIARLVVYREPLGFYRRSSEGASVFWGDTVDLLRLQESAAVEKGRAYRAFSEELRRDLPKGPRAAAFEVAQRLESRIRNLGQATYLELAAMTRKEAGREMSHRDLDGAVKRGGTTSQGMRHLYQALLQDAGIPFKLVWMYDKRVAIFEETVIRHAPLEGPILGIEEPDQPTLWVDPTLRFAQPGLLLPEYQGVGALEVLPGKEAWKYRKIDLPHSAPGTNRRQDIYRLELGDEEDRFSLEARFLGIPEFLERRGYYGLEPADQNRKLKAALESSGSEVRLDSAEVVGAIDPRDNLRWKATGHVDRSPGRLRFVQPFPVTPTALWMPPALPLERKEPIALPYRMVWSAECAFRIPPGETWTPIPPFQRGNAFGKVHFSATRAGDELKVVRHVLVDAAVMPASAYGEFRQFLGWIQEAQKMGITLERDGTAR